MLPMPGSPSFSWPMFRQRMGTYVDGVDWNVVIAFWLFGKADLTLFSRLVSTTTSNSISP